MGKGLFAIKDIPRGTRILSEVPIMQIPHASEDDLDAPAFCAVSVPGPSSLEWSTTYQKSFDSTNQVRLSRLNAHPGSIVKRIGVM